MGHSYQLTVFSKSKGLLLLSGAVRAASSFPSLGERELSDALALPASRFVRGLGTSRARSPCRSFRD